MLTRTEAETITSKLKKIRDVLVPLWEEALAGKIWTAMGYESFQDWFVGEGLEVIRLEPPERREAISQIKRENPRVSTRELAGTLGVSHTTIERDLEKVGTYVPNYTSKSDKPDNSPHNFVDSTTTSAGVQVVVDPFRAWSDEELKLRECVQQGESVVVSKRKGAEYASLLDWAHNKDLYVDITRNSKWGNPFELPVDGSRAEVIYNYEYHYLPYKPSLTAILHELRGKVLVCWCAPEPCHGDVLKRLAEDTTYVG
jgi:hypothetical protein